MSDLLPCPFCGSNSFVFLQDEERGFNVAVVCQYTPTHGCGMRGPYRGTQKDAEAAWNTRAPSAPSAAVEDSETLSAVIAEMRGREQVGIAKYGITVDRSDMTHTQWATHLSEELMDALLYLKRMQTSDTNCTCPSGDGSLRWPCPKHPPIHANLDEVARDALTDIVQYGIDNEGFTGEGMAWCIERAWKAKETIAAAIQSASRGEG